nr:multicopper oxidase domain-containing protein [Gemmatimonadaceae bacterium]
AWRVVRAPRVPRVVPNDNRVAAGARHDALVRLRLVARLGEWHPDGDDRPGVVLPAFAEDGRAPRIPGPLLRVVQGTQVEVTLRNALATDTLRVHGLHARPLASPADSAPIVLAPGAVHTARFVLHAVGTFYYWGTTTRRALNYRTGLDAQLTGAIVVDPAGRAPARDRIVVMGMWTDTVARSFLSRTRVLGVMNGRSWPATESLSATVGDTVRWRVINASGDLHPMHLHGFHFRVTARGDGVTDTLLTEAESPLVVTEAATMGATFAMTWVPTRPGNWLFHCHIPEHFGPRGTLGLPRAAAAPAIAASAHAAHAVHGAAAHGAAAHAGMNGLVLGVTVRPPPGRSPAAAAPAPTAVAARALRLLVRANVGSSAAAPAFGYAIHERGDEPAPDTGLVAQPTLVVTRGEPVQVTVVNRLTEPTSVHWHGIELESYYDGVPGFSGLGARTAPLVAPGDSFVVRFTPPRTGTFIYHTHHDEERQMEAGLAGALLVVEPGTRVDPVRDHVVLLTSPSDDEEATRVILVNARRSPAPLVLRAGTVHRLRLINMTMRRSGVHLLLRGAVATPPWTLLAKDGAESSAAQRARAPRAQLLSIGETIDLELATREAESFTIEVRGGPQPTARVLARVPVEVRADTGAP